ncbi:MAG: TVP38/TMEM64 family protein [Limnothrix sp. RL_2_0]|nr:TVP38/TMEM64 family protein [Limnothrix sp. RL_2_0]
MTRFLKVLRKSNFSKLQFWQKIGWWIALVCLGAIACLTFHFRHIVFNVDHLATFFTEALPCCLVLLFLGLYIVLTVVGMPGTVLTTVGGILFGLSWGTFWSVLGATLGALGAFWTARYLLKDWLCQKFRHHPALHRLDQSVSKQPLSLVLTLRFAPISPFNLLNFLFGLTPIHWFPYTLGTFIGIIPGTMIYTWLGVSGKTAFSGGDRLPLIIALGLLTTLSLLPYVATQLRQPKP